MYTFTFFWSNISAKTNVDYSDADVEQCNRLARLLPVEECRRHGWGKEDTSVVGGDYNHSAAVS